MASTPKNTGPEKSALPSSNPDKTGFTPEVLDKTIIAIPLLKDIKDKGVDALFDIIIDLNLNFPGGRKEASMQVIKLIESLIEAAPEAASGKTEGYNEVKTKISTQYVFATLRGGTIQKLVVEDNAQPKRESTDIKPLRSIYRIWPDFKVKALITKSISTVKADAARSSFSAFGAGVTWAVIDSGIYGKHRHFDLHDNIHPSYHKDFTVQKESDEDPLNDAFGHGTHVAGIICGEMIGKVKAIVRHRDEQGNIVYEPRQEEKISGMAPQCKLVSLKVLDDAGNGNASNLIVAIEYVQELNGYGRDLKIHGVNMSLGYDFDPEWFACGQSPLCVEVDRLVKSGVFVIVAAGNSGYGYEKTEYSDVKATGLVLSINDPGNAELAITVGSTHRDMPHTYGVSYFSSKGPTGDGRLKPDVVAPGEKIISCAAGLNKKEAEDKLDGKQKCDYVEDSGTSMAAPHVSGVIAAFLSIRKEYIGKPEVVKEIFLTSATDLKRDKYFQGHGLVDLMRAIQSV